MLLECHITIPLEKREVGLKVAGVFGWKTSEIARDPVLGEASYFYLTSHDNNVERMFARMRQVAYTLLEEGGQDTIVREKIELIIYDTKVKT